MAVMCVSFLTYVLFAICILPRNNAAPTTGLTANLMQNLENEMDIFDNLIDAVQSSNFDLISDQVDELQERIKSTLMERNRVVAECKQLLREKWKLENEKDNSDMYQLLLALPYRVETLEKMLAPGVNLAGKQASKRWLEIFNLHTPAVEDLRRKVKAAGMTEVSFAESVERLIQERNNRAGHANVPLPRLVNEKTIEAALRIMNVTEDEIAVETIKILIAPVKGLDFTTTTTSTTTHVPEE